MIQCANIQAVLIKVLFVVGKNESLRRKLLHFWDELTSTMGWRLTGYGSWAVEEKSVPLPGLIVVTARESCLQCFPDSAEAILLAHDFVRVKTIMGHQSTNARYFKAPQRILPTVRRFALPSQALNYPSMFKVILAGTLPTRQSCGSSGKDSGTSSPRREPGSGPSSPSSPSRTTRSWSRRKSRRCRALCTRLPSRYCRLTGSGPSSPRPRWSRSSSPPPTFPTSN